MYRDDYNSFHIFKEVMNLIHLTRLCSDNCLKDPILLTRHYLLVFKMFILNMVMCSFA